MLTEESLPRTKLTIEDMWMLNENRENNTLETPRKYFDHIRSKKQGEYTQRLEKALKEGTVSSKPIYKTDKNGKAVIPKRLNYLDDAVKLANSYYSPEKAKLVLEKGKKSHSKDLKPLNMPNVLYRSNRETYIDKVFRQARHEEKLSEQLKEKVEKTVDKLKRYPPLTEEEKLKKSTKGVFL
jgi:hypothetical protein